MKKEVLISATGTNHEQNMSFHSLIMVSQDLDLHCEAHFNAWGARGQHYFKLLSTVKKRLCVRVCGCFSAPPLSHTHSRREPGEGRRLRDGEMLIIRGEAADSSQYTKPKQRP